MIPSRRRFLLGAGLLLAAPSIVRAATLMPVSTAATNKIALLAPSLRPGIELVFDAPPNGPSVLKSMSWHDGSSVVTIDLPPAPLGRLDRVGYYVDERGMPHAAIWTKSGKHWIRKTVAPARA